MGGHTKQNRILILVKDTTYLYFKKMFEYYHKFLTNLCTNLQEYYVTQYN